MFSKRNRKHVFCFYRVIKTLSLGGSLRELKKAVETLACSLCSHSVPHSPKVPLMCLQLDRNTICVLFYFLIKAA